MTSRMIPARGLLSRAMAASAVVLSVVALGLGTAHSHAQQPAPQDPKDADKKKGPDAPKVKLGLNQNDPGAYQGYTLLNPMGKKTTYLLDMMGRVVHKWDSAYDSMHAAYLLPNGDLFRVAVLAGGEFAFGGGPGSAGRLQEFAWDGKLVWDYQFHNARQYPHHDAARLANGNILMIVWDKKTKAEAIAAGRKPELVSEYLLPDSVIEIKPTGESTAEIVWEWHLWDHLVQDFDATRANYGVVADHPELVDLNFVESPMGPGPGGPGPGGPGPGGPGPGGPGPKARANTPPPDTKKEAARKAEAEKLKSIGYVGSPRQRAQRINPDWTHVNSIDYNPRLDQIVLSVHEFSEIWIIDHSTTTAEAASHQGGRSGKGGDLLYRWGNPRVYRAGTRADQTLFAQHNAQWIKPGLPGEGHLLVFNNGSHRPDGDYSSVDELVPPVNEAGHYFLQKGQAYGPAKPVWSYIAPRKSDFYASFISGASRMPNGNTLICSGPNGTIFEVTPDKKVVWKYVNPVKGGFNPGGRGPGGRRPGELFSGMERDMLGLKAEQREKLDDLQKKVDDVLRQELSDDQRRILGERSAPGAGGFAALPAPGQIMAVSTQVALKPTPAQRTILANLQKEVDGTLERIFTAEQKKLFKQARTDFARRGPGGPPPGGPGFGPPPGGPPPGGPGGPRPGFPGGPPGGSGLFRAYRYGPDFPGLAGHELKPGKTVEELEPREPEQPRPAPARKAETPRESARS